MPTSSEGRDDIIGSDSPLSEAQRATLDAVLDLLIPPSEDGRLPGAAEIGMLTHLCDTASDVVPALREELNVLDERARERFDCTFASLAEQDRQSLLDEIRAADTTFLQGLIVETLTCYYRDDRVLEAIGMEARPPFPDGYEVDSGDLTLLDPVIKRGKRFRDA